MMVILLLVSGAVGFLLILSGLIVLLAPSKKRSKSKEDAPQTLSQALGLEFGAIAEPTRMELMQEELGSAKPAPADVQQTTVADASAAVSTSVEIPPTATDTLRFIVGEDERQTSVLQTEITDPAVTVAATSDVASVVAPTAAPDATVVANEAKPSVSAEQIKQLVTNHEILITLINGVHKMNNARKDEQVVKTAKTLSRTTENFENMQSWLALKPYIEAIYPNFFRKLIATTHTAGASNDSGTDIVATATVADNVTVDNITTVTDKATAAAPAAEEENLTDFEIRVCMLQIFDFTSKEIAQITNRSIRTIETTVYRIRKKLSIPTETRLSDFLKNL